MPINLNGISKWGIHLGSIEICNVYVGAVLIRSCEESSLVTVSSNSSVLTSRIQVFSEQSFTLNFATQVGETYDKVIIKSVPEEHSLLYLGELIDVGFSFKAINSSGLKLKLADNFAVYDSILYRFDESIDVTIYNMDVLGYILISNSNGELIFRNIENTQDIITIKGEAVDNSSLNFNFLTTDNLGNESNIAEFTITTQAGDINVKPLPENQPATIGDITLKVDRNKTTVITMDMLTSQASPPYNDPENDLADAIRIKAISPSNTGIFYLNNVAVSVGQIITREEANSGIFIHVGVNENDLKTDRLTFEIRDEGSGIWVE